MHTLQFFKINYGEHKNEKYFVGSINEWLAINLNPIRIFLSTISQLWLSSEHNHKVTSRVLRTAHPVIHWEKLERLTIIFTHEYIITRLSHWDKLRITHQLVRQYTKVSTGTPLNDSNLTKLNMRTIYWIYFMYNTMKNWL